MSAPRLQRTKTCNHCKKEFKAKRVDAKFCSPKCQQGNKKALKISKRLKKLPRTSFVRWLVHEVKRAGTVEILKDTSLPELQVLRKKRNLYSGFSGGKVQTNVYDLAHIAPVCHPKIVGLLHPENLAIVPSSFNRSYKAQWVEGSGRYILRSSLKQQWRVCSDTPEADVIKKITRYLGAEKLSEFVADNDLTLTFRESLLDFLEAQDFKLPIIVKKDTEALKKLAIEHGFKESKFTQASESDSVVASLELARLAPTNSLCHLMQELWDTTTSLCYSGSCRLLKLSDIWGAIHGVIPSNLAAIRLQVIKLRISHQRPKISCIPMERYCNIFGEPEAAKPLDFTPYIQFVKRRAPAVPKGYQEAIGRPWIAAKAQQQLELSQPLNPYSFEARLRVLERRRGAPTPSVFYGDN